MPNWQGVETNINQEQTLSTVFESARAYISPNLPKTVPWEITNPLVKLSL